MFDHFISKYVHIFRTQIARINRKINESTQSSLVLSLPAHFGRGIHLYPSLCPRTRLQAYRARRI